MTTPDPTAIARGQLSALLASLWLTEMTEYPVDYEARNRLVYAALSLAFQAGIPAGIRIDPAEPEWPVIYIELPTGQVSWHVPQHGTAWDGHTTEAKYARVAAFVGRVPPITHTARGKSPEEE